VSSSPDWKWGFWRRVRRVVVEGLGQSKLHQYRVAGLAHHVIFIGFLVLLLRTLTLLFRAYFPSFQLIASTTNDSSLFNGAVIYRILREYAALFVLVGVVVFAVLRLGKWERRLTASREGFVILTIIATMMVCDFLYDACGQSLAIEVSSMPLGLGGVPSQPTMDFIAPFLGEGPPLGFWATPGSTIVTLFVGHLPGGVRLWIGLLSYYLHVGLVATFLLLIPNSKHFHIVLALPNLFLSSVKASRPLEPLAKDVDGLCARVEAAMESEDLEAAPIGKARIEHWNAKERLDWFACTECGRCSEHCPAHRTHKPLEPRQVTLALREQLKSEKGRLLGKSDKPAVPLVPGVIKPATLWACTTCRACEEQCPVGVNYLDTIVGLRRHLVTMRGEVPTELQRAFDGMERNHNPWNFPKAERTEWTKGLSVPLISEVSSVEFLYWVGCAASYDERAKAVARSLVRLMQRAKVSFAILGSEERCTGESARKAGNELLFLQLAAENIETLNRYRNRYARILTACPHCLSTLSQDYADFGGHYEVLSHAAALEQWVNSGRLKLRQGDAQIMTYHDPCTLARGASVTESPRRLLASIPGVTLKEPEHHGRQTLCCGAGGAQLWLEEQNVERMNVRRAKELIGTMATQIVSACPFCLTMVKDGVAAMRVGAEVHVDDLTSVIEKVVDD
jgi:Fe-S oxidoreductase